METFEQDRHAFSEHVFLSGKVFQEMDGFRHLTTGDGCLCPVLRQPYRTFDTSGPRAGNVARNPLDLGVVISFYHYPVILPQPSEGRVHFSDELRFYECATQGHGNSRYKP